MVYGREEIELEGKNLIPRGTKLITPEYIYGIVTYTGNQTKM